MKIAYRDYVQDGTLDAGSSGTEAGFSDIFSAGSPFSNAQTRQLAMKAVLDISPHYSFFFVVDFGESKDIDLVAILGHNFNRSNGLYRARASVGNAPFTGTLVDHNPGWLPPDESAFTRNQFFIFDSTVSGRYLTIAIELGAAGPLPIVPSFGRVWAGPAWGPREVPGTGRRSFRVQTRDDDSVLDKSDGQQGYADAKPCFRQLTCTLPWVTEAEAIGTEDGETQNLQDIAFEVGKTQPVIVIPSDRNQQVIHRFGLYGTFADPPSVDLIEDSAGTEETGLAYSTQFDVTEEL